jgi:deoxyribodipyrimidine photo-lyase
MILILLLGVMYFLSSSKHQGKTGYPIVDAGMRQLAETGWMHNRARMTVASFLCKHLLLDWRLGEKWFSQNLIDHDFAANNGGWQWSASTGIV